MSKFIKLTTTSEGQATGNVYIKKDFITSILTSPLEYPPCTEINAQGELYWVEETPEEIIKMLK